MLPTDPNEGYRSVGSPRSCWLVLGCFAWFGCDPNSATGAGAADAGERGSFVAMTLNAKWNDSISNSYAERVACMAAFVAAERVDILAVQEIRSDMAPETALWAALASSTRAAGSRYERFAGAMRNEHCPPMNRCGMRPCSDGQACDSLDPTREQLPIYWNADRFSLRDAGVHKLDGEASSYTRSLSWVALEDLQTGAELAVYNVHIDHFRDGKRAQVQRIAEIIESNKHASSPLLVLGDFNLSVMNDEGRTWLSPVADVLGLEIANDPKLGTYHGFSGKGGTGGAIDYLFHSTHLATETYTMQRDPDPACPVRVINCEDHRLLGDATCETRVFETLGYYSDHFPVSARLKLVD